MSASGLLLGIPPALRTALARLLVAVLVAAFLVPAPAVASTRGDDPAAPGAPAPVAAPLPPPPGTTTLISQKRGGGYPNNRSLEPSISGNGRFIAFSSSASNIVAGDNNQAPDVFLVDRSTGRTIRIPVIGGPVPTGGSASEPAISADGSVVVFTYQPPPAAVLAGAGTTPAILAYTRATGRTTAVSPAPKGIPGSGAREPSISADGRFVAYTMNWVWVGRAAWDAVVRVDRNSGQSALVSVGPEGQQLGAPATSPSISADGNLVAFVCSGGDTVVHENTGGGTQVYVRDMRAKRTERISAASDGGPANGSAADPAISGNGRYVAFTATATNLVSGPGSGSGGLFRRDRRTGKTIMVSLTTDGTAAPGLSFQPSISPDGNMVAFATNVAALISIQGDTSTPFALSRSESVVVLRDIAAGETVLVSVPRTTPPPDSPNQSVQPAVAGNGRYVAFASNSPVLVGTDTGRFLDVFLRDMPPVPAINPAALDLGATAVNVEGAPSAVTVTNGGWSPLAVVGASVTGANKKDFRIVADGCAGRVLKRNEACTISVTFKPQAKGTRSATLAVADRFTGSPRTVRLRGRASQATLDLDPPIGPPGIVTIVRGSDFPKGAVVKLHWSVGITPDLPDVAADDQGSFEIPVLVFHNDVTGPRDLVAEPAAGSGFPGTSSPMLVTPPSAVPPNFELLRIIDLPFALVFRG